MTDFVISDLGDDLYRLLEAKAEAKGISIEEAARQALTKYAHLETPGRETRCEPGGARSKA